jgi:hypothetical protein
VTGSWRRSTGGRSCTAIPLRSATGTRRWHELRAARTAPSATPRARGPGRTTRPSSSTRVVGRGDRGGGLAQQAARQLHRGPASRDSGSAQRAAPDRRADGARVRRGRPGPARRVRDAPGPQAARGRVTVRRCTGTTRAGEPCRAAPLKGCDHCSAHDPLSPAETRSGSVQQASRAGAQGGARAAGRGWST